MRRAVGVLCVAVLCVAIRSVVCESLLTRVGAEWMLLEQKMVDSGCAEKLVDQNLLAFLRTKSVFENISDLDLRLFQLFVRLTSVLISKNRPGDLCAKGVVDREPTAPLCGRAPEYLQLATSLRSKGDPVLSATAEILHGLLKDEATCEITCTPGFGAALCSGIIKSARTHLTLTTTQERAGNSRKLLSSNQDLESAFQKNLPLTNEQIDAFNRGERKFIDEQLALSILKPEDIQQEMEKALLELQDDEDYRLFKHRKPVPAIHEISVPESSHRNFIAVTLVAVVSFAVLAYSIYRWRDRLLGKAPLQRKIY